MVRLVETVVTERLNESSIGALILTLEGWILWDSVRCASAFVFSLFSPISWELVENVYTKKPLLIRRISFFCLNNIFPYRKLKNVSSLRLCFGKKTNTQSKIHKINFYRDFFWIIHNHLECLQTFERASWCSKLMEKAYLIEKALVIGLCYFVGIVIRFVYELDINFISRTTLKFEKMDFQRL